MISIAILAVSVALTGCSTISPKTHEGKGYSKAKEIMVSAGVPFDYIRDGDSPLSAKIEGVNVVDSIAKHAGLATAVSTLSITSTFMATMASSDYEEKAIWKKTLSKVILLNKIDSSKFNNSKESIIAEIFSNYMSKKGFLEKNIGLYEKNGINYNLTAGFSEPFLENGKEFKYVLFGFADSSVKFNDPNYSKAGDEFFKSFFNENSLTSIYKYSPPKDGEPAYVEHNGVKHYFVKGQ